MAGSETSYAARNVFLDMELTGVDGTTIKALFIKPMLLIFDMGFELLNKRALRLCQGFLLRSLLR